MPNDTNNQAFNNFARQDQVQIEKINEELDKLQKKQAEMTANFRSHTQAFQDNSKAIKDTGLAIKEMNDQIAKNAEVLKMSRGSLQQNKAILESLLERYDKLSGAQGNNAKEVASLNRQIGNLSATIDDQEKKLKKSREVFDAQTASVDALKTAFDKIKTSNEAFGPVLEDAAKGFNAMKSGLAVVKTGFDSVGGAIKTTGFGLLVLVLQSLTEYLTTNANGLQKLHGIMAVVGKVVNTVKAGFSGLGEVIVDAVTHPIDSIKAAGRFIVENLLNRLKAFGVIIDGIIHLDLKKIGDGIMQGTTGIANATDKIKNAYNQTKNAVTDAGKAIVKTYNEGAAAEKKKQEDDKKTENLNKARQQVQEERDRKNLSAAQKQLHADEDRIASVARVNEAIFKSYAKEVTDTEKHFASLEKKYKNSADKLEQIQNDKVAAFAAINKRFQEEDQAKLDGYLHQLAQIAVDNLTDSKQKAIAQLALDTGDKLKALDADDKTVQDKIQQQQKAIQELKRNGKTDEVKILEASIALEEKLLEPSKKIKQELLTTQTKQQNDINGRQGANDFNDTNQNDFANKKDKKQNEDAVLQEKETAKKRTQINDEFIASKIHAGDKYINAVLANSKKDSAIYKAAFLAKKATSVADTIISTRQAVIDSLKAYSGIPFIGQALGIAQAAYMAAQGAASIATIIKQKPGFASGGRYVSDGRGAVLAGYSRTDDTNAYLRSGEAVVVSEAMRNPWARNLVSAINVAHGGRDFSVPSTGYGYAIGGIYTDGGNANRYYNQPVNDIKEMANTLAYQMINNFPPIYVDVKDVNNQQNILAQTVNRVNL